MAHSDDHHVGVIGALQLPCNPLWADDCRLPMGRLVRMLRDAGAPAVATCSAPTVCQLEDCLPGFGTLPSPNGEQIYIDIGGPLWYRQGKNGPPAS